MKFIITLVVMAFLASSTSAFAWSKKSSGASKKSSGSGSYKKAYAPKKSFSK